jgi:hypothetical protein
MARSLRSRAYFYFNTLFMTYNKRGPVGVVPLNGNLPRNGEKSFEKEEEAE